MELKKKKFFLSYNLQVFSADPEPTDPKEPNEPNEPKDEPKKLELSEDVQKYLQSEMDKIRTKAAKEKEQLKEQLENLKKDKMTDAEKKDYELQQQREELERDRAELNRLKLEGTAVEILKGLEMDLDFKPFVLASDEDSTKIRANTLHELFEKAVQARVDKLYGENGRTPERSNGFGGQTVLDYREMATKNNLRNQ